MLAKPRLFADASDPRALESAPEVPQRLACPLIGRHVEVDLPILDPVALDELSDLSPALFGLSLPFLGERDLRVRRPRVHALVDVALALAVPDKDYAAGPRRGNLPMQPQGFLGKVGQFFVVVASIIAADVARVWRGRSALDGTSWGE